MDIPFPARFFSKSAILAITARPMVCHHHVRKVVIAHAVVIAAGIIGVGGFLLVLAFFMRCRRSEMKNVEAGVAEKHNSLGHDSSINIC